MSDKMCQIFAKDKTSGRDLEPISGKEIEGRMTLINSSYSLSSAGVVFSPATSTNQTNGEQITKSNLQVGGNPVTTSNPVPITPPLSGSLPVSSTTLASASNQTDGSQKTKITDGYGFSVEATPTDELRVAEPTRLVGTIFEGATLDTNFWTATLGANGTAVSGSGMLTLTTTADSGSSAAVQSVRTGRYVSGHSNRFRAQIRVGDVTTTSNKRRWGVFTTGAGSNGCFFEEANGAISVVTRKNNSDTLVASASWNGSTTVPTLSNVNTYEIYYTNKKVYFVINGVLVHTVTATTTNWSDVKTLPIRFENSNTGVGSVETLGIWAATIARLGKEQTSPTYKYIAGAATTVCKLGAGTLHKITVNSAGTLCTVYDQTSGAVPLIGIIDTNKTTGTIGILTYDCPFFNGLTVVTTGAGSDITVIYE